MWRYIPQNRIVRSDRCENLTPAHFRMRSWGCGQEVLKDISNHFARFDPRSSSVAHNALFPCKPNSFVCILTVFACSWLTYQTWQQLRIHHGRSCHGLSHNIIPEFARSDWGKQLETWVRTVDVPAWYLPNTIQKNCYLSQLASFYTEYGSNMILRNVSNRLLDYMVPWPETRVLNFNLREYLKFHTHQ
jgi:hypothetical protein